MNRSYEIYISEIRNQIISSEEELRLAQIYKDRSAGWEEAKDQIVKSNLLYVVKVAFEFSNDSFKVPDLISEGNIGLLDSLERFDPSLGIKLITFANKEIRGKMMKYLLKNNYFAPFKMSFKTRNEAKKVKAFCEEYKTTHGEKPSASIIQNEFHVSKYDAEIYLEMTENVIFSMDASTQDGDNELSTLIEDETVICPDSALDQKQVSEIVLKIISRLPLRERTVMNKRFGLNGETPTDLQTIGLQFDLTKERIRQIEVSAIKKIQSEMERLKAK